VDFTREPVIETIITPREGYRLVVRSSKNVGQEEHFVDALEVVSFGNSCFFRSTERPKPFLVPIADYEVLEVREQRLVLKAKIPEGAVKIGREGHREHEKKEEKPREEPQEEPALESEKEAHENEGPKERRRDRRQRYRRRGSRQPMMQKEGVEPSLEEGPQAEVPLNVDVAPLKVEGVPEFTEGLQESKDAPPVLFRTVLPPPSTLIRDDLQRLRENVEYRGAFFIRDEKSDDQDDDDAAIELIEQVGEPTLENKEGPLVEEEPFLVAETNEKTSQEDVGQEYLSPQ
jgi:hypothetical protein